MRAKVSEELEHDARWFEIGPISAEPRAGGNRGAANPHLNPAIPTYG